MENHAGSISSISDVGANTVTPTGSSLAPPHIALSENSLQINIHKLKGKNYLEWTQSVRLAINGKGKLEHLNGKVKPLESKNPKY